MASYDRRFSSLLNFRDIGGLPASDNRIVRKGLLFRSANPDRLSVIDQKILRDLGIKTFIDLRAPHEVHKDSIEIDHAVKVSLPLDFQKATRERIQPVLRKKGSEPLIADISNALYIEILDASVPIFREVVEIIIDQDRLPAVIHCQVGKDRTGIITALVLMALGVDRDLIVADFMKSNDELYKSFRNHFLTRTILTFGYFPYRKLMYAVAVKQRNIESIISRVQDHYGGIGGFLEASGLPATKLIEVRNRLLEE